MSVLVTNAYSASNSGDGLLVDLSVEVLRDAGYRSPPVVIAADPGSFPSHECAPAPAAIGLSTSRRVSESAVALLAPTGIHRVSDLVRGAPLVLAVGGGYLRAGLAQEAFKSAVVHLSQIRAASRVAPVILLPQSIGPLRYGRMRYISTLANCRYVHVRDDRTADELSSLDNVVRTPDLAVLAMSKRPPSLAPDRSSRVAFFARALARPRNYESLLRNVINRIPVEAIAAVQSTAGSGNDDTSFLRRLDIPVVGSASSVLSSARPPALVVSTRLHGALASVLAGVPAIHLSYERKGFGAYDDLGVGQYVHNARDFDADLVLSQIEELLSSPDLFFDRVGQALPAIESHRASLINRVRSELPG